MAVHIQNNASEYGVVEGLPQSFRLQGELAFLHHDALKQSSPTGGVEVQQFSSIEQKTQVEAKNVVASNDIGVIAVDESIEGFH